MGAHKTQWIKEGGIIPGPKEVQSAYRSEVGGLVGIAVCLTSLSSHLNHTEPPFTTACDGLSALRKVHATKEMVKPSWKHVDLLTGRIDLWENLPMKARLEHVLGHQDDVGRPLTILERINVRMDSTAKTIACTYPKFKTKQLAGITLGYGTVTIVGTLICSKLQKSLYDAIGHQIDRGLLDKQVNWYCLGKARKEASFPVKKFISKWVSGDTATGVVMKRRQQRIEDNCPRCKEPHEHLLHVLVWKDNNTSEFRKGLMEEFQIWLQKEKTEPNLERFLTLGLQSWIDDPMRREPEYVVHSQKRESAVTTQVNLGWYAFLCGFVAKPLIDIQHEHYLELQLKKKAER
jgi:hypothetical protein